jgi:hypothetical protein
MGRPSITVQIAFASNPLATPVWTDVTSYVRADRPISIRRGRQQALSRIEAGTCSLTLNNLDRRFDPTNNSSPYAPNVVPNRRMRIRATWNSVTYDLFTGFIDEWPPAWPLTNDSSVTIRATDAFKPFARKKVTLSRGAEYSNWRIVAMLDAFGWPAGDRSIANGQSLIQAVSLDKTPILQHLQDVATSENGQVFVDGSGRVVFQDRHWRLTNPAATTAQAIFGDSGTELPYTDLRPSYDESELYNEILVTRVGGTTQSAVDTASQDAYLPLTLERSGLLMTTDNEAFDAANWLLRRYKAPALRFKAMTVDGQANDAIWPHALGRTISDRITVRRRPPGGGLLIAQDCLIEAMEHQISSTRWNTSWQLSPATSSNFLVFDSATLGTFDANAFTY